jgi:diguanylate cyclase (GGDEF)-like protein
MAEERRPTLKFPHVSEVSVGEVPASNLPDEAAPSQVSPSIMPRHPSFIDSDRMDVDTSVTRPTETAIAAHPAVVQRDRAILTVLMGLNAGQVFTLDTDEITIGRGREAHIRVEDVGISRAHSRIVRTMEGKFVVEDLGSTNGTFVSGKRIERAELHTGDRLQVGPNVVLRFAILDEAEEKLAHQLYEASTKDGLTKVYNRKYFVERMAAEVAYSHRHKAPLSLILFDLDHFKRVNDTHGHLAGDVVLRLVAAQVQKTIRTEDVLARYGGEEFVILVRGVAHVNSARFAERVRKAVERLTIPWESDQIKATISIGVSSLSEIPPEEGTGDALLHLADSRLYGAKASGRNRVVSA